jgi:hypothetical protein
VFLPGTGKIKDQHFCSEVADRYVKESAVENQDYEIINGDLWEFLQTRYGFDYEVRRIYYEGQWSYQSKLEVTYKLVPVIFVFTDDFVNSKISEEMAKVRYVQVRKTHTVSDLKKRLSDCIQQMTKSSDALKAENLRLWAMDTAKVKLTSSLQIVQESLKRNSPMKESENENVEENSGVTFPGGRSLEPYVGTAQVVKDFNFHGVAIVVEISAQNRFIFKYIK